MAQNLGDYLNEVKYILNVGVYAGTGAPTFTAKQGSIYIRTDGSSSSTRMYINTDGATTWTSFTTAA